MASYAHSHWQQRSNATPSIDGYIKSKSSRKYKAAAFTPPPAPPSDDASMCGSSASSVSDNPYRISTKCGMVAKLSSSRTQ